MRLPRTDDVVELQHGGKPFRALVETVKDDLVTLVLATSAPILKPRDQVRWIEPKGAAVSIEKVPRGKVPRIVLPWGGRS